MSSPAQGGPAVPKDREKRLSRVLTRVKTVFKKAETKRPTKPESSTAAAGGSSAASAAAPAEASTSKPAAAAADPPRTPDGAVKVPRSQIFEERAKKLSERFGIDITPSEWHSTEGHALRVEKPIRMRVHRECHKCGHTFGLARECPGCAHPRCRECLRKPPKRTDAERAASRQKRALLEKERAENPPIIADWDPSSGRKVVLTRPSKQGGQDLVHKKPRQRVRRTCCQCSALFVGAEKTCPGCQHARCTDCPRDPSKKDKYPYGYPGDEFGAKSIPHYECHECKTKFPPNPPDGAECAKCSHTRCESCPRLTPRKVEPEPDPELWKRVQEKLGALDIKDK